MNTSKKGLGILYILNVPEAWQGNPKQHILYLAIPHPSSDRKNRNNLGKVILLYPTGTEQGTYRYNLVPRANWGD
ncbi:hypothetical protein [Sinomicrobium oceani]|uniref:hypothetical protein n=1 Tax=Sinomicrobium oceani TaxID=1150368 RepID=UPI00227B95F0|nr:hypothetical protein [Sinomicrobium oceani]